MVPASCPPDPLPLPEPEPDPDPEPEPDPDPEPLPLPDPDPDPDPEPLPDPLPLPDPDPDPLLDAVPELDPLDDPLPDPELDPPLLDAALPSWLAPELLASAPAPASLPDDDDPLLHALATASGTSAKLDTRRTRSTDPFALDRQGICIALGYHRSRASQREADEPASPAHDAAPRNTTRAPPSRKAPPSHAHLRRRRLGGCLLRREVEVGPNVRRRLLARAPRTGQAATPSRFRLAGARGRVAPHGLQPIENPTHSVWQLSRHVPC